MLLAAVVGLAALASAAQAMHFSAWTAAQKIDEIGGNSSELNTSFQDGCPIQSPDGLSLYFSSKRPGGLGLLDIWVARRASKDAPWGAPVNLGDAVNTGVSESRPSLSWDARALLFGRSPGPEGSGDIYVSTRGVLR